MVNRIIIGRKDAPLLEFYNDSIISITEDTSVAMVGGELSVDQFVPVIKYNLFIRYQITPADRDKYDRILTAEGLVLCSKYNYDIRAIPYGTPVYFFVDDRPAGIYYVNKPEHVSKNTFKINCFSDVGLMDKQRHTGDVYTGERFDHVLAELLSGVVEGEHEYIVDSDVAEQRVYGWLPYGTKRSNLHQLLIAYGVNKTKSDTGVPLYTFLKATDSETIPSDRVYNEGSVVYGEAASRVEILEHGFYYLSSVDDEVLFDTSGNVAENTVVVFNKPIYKDSITVQEGGDLRIIESGTNYAVVSGTGVLVGKPYVHTKKFVSAENEDAPTEKIITVENATLITMANSENCLQRIAGFYFNATTVRNSIVVEGEKPGKRYVFQNPFNEHTSAFLASMSSFSSSVIKAECEFIQDYIPVEHGAAFMAREILELSEDEQKWIIPESVYKKDLPQIRAVLIGAGYDGENGSNGESGQRGDNKTGGEGGKGGSGGKGGKGGKILSVTIDCSNLAFLRYGKTGKNTWLFAGDDSYNSGNGFSSASGFVELFTGAVYALPGSDGQSGADGGAGGIYAPIAQHGGTISAENGKDVKFEGETFKGGKARAKFIFKGNGSNGAHENMHVYCGGAAGGGAAVGANGEDANTAVDLLGGPGGNGADALAAKPTVELYGSGGNGGSGGGGGGGSGKQHWWNHVYTTLIGIGTTPPGIGGKGSEGSKGYRGCIILYY